MAIRIRTITHKGESHRVALCAAETDPEPGDVYLDDNDHHALAAKLSQDYDLGIDYEEEFEAMETQKLRDAEEELANWINGR